MKYHYYIDEQWKVSAFAVKGGRVPKVYTVKQEPSGPVLGHITEVRPRLYRTSRGGQHKRLRDAVISLVRIIKRG